MRGDGSAGDSSGLRNGSGARQEGSLAGDAPSGRAPGASTDPELHSETASPRDPRINWDDLVALAHHMTQLSYCPYSHYRVGAAGLAADGRVVRGCNVENAAYGVALCAECGLVSDLVAGGGRQTPRLRLRRRRRRADHAVWSVPPAVVGARWTRSARLDPEGRHDDGRRPSSGLRRDGPRQDREQPRNAGGLRARPCAVEHRMPRRAGASPESSGEDRTVGGVPCIDPTDRRQRAPHR